MSPEISVIGLEPMLVGIVSHVGNRKPDYIVIK